MFLEQHKMVKGLSEPSLFIWYGGQTIDTPETEISNAQEYVRFIICVWDLKMTVPRHVLNTSSGVCITETGGSQRHLNNIAVTLKLIEDLVRADVFTIADIVIQTPYRAQGLNYRSALYTASKMTERLGPTNHHGRQLSRR